MDGGNEDLLRTAVFPERHSAQVSADCCRPQRESLDLHTLILCWSSNSHCLWTVYNVELGRVRDLKLVSAGDFASLSWATDASMYFCSSGEAPLARFDAPCWANVVLVYVSHSMHELLQNPETQPNIPFAYTVHYHPDPNQHSKTP